MMRRLPAWSLLMSLAGALAGCAAAGGPNGGAANLPNRGIVPWTRFAPSADDPLVAAPVAPATPNASAESWHAPSALVVGGKVRLYVDVLAQDGSRHVAVLESDADGEHFAGTPTPCLAEAASAPSVTRATDGTFWMAYVDGATTRIGIARSADGTTFDTPTVTALEGAAPSLVIDGDRFVVYATVAGHIVRAEAGRDLQFGAPATVLEPGTACVDAFGKDKACWDSGALVDSDVRIAKTPAGRRVYRMLYAANSGGLAHIGFAASFDGVSWQRFAYNPVLNGDPAEFAPSEVLLGDRYLLYYELSAPPRVGIALAIDEPDATSDAW